MKTAAVVLAAGRSSRMGVNKLLLEVEGKTVLDRLLESLTQAVDEVVVVVGNNPDPIKKIAKAHDVLVAYNSDYEKGMTTSFQAGLSVVKGADAVFLILGDQLGLRLEFLKRMLAALEDLPGALIVSPTHNGKRGHPVLFNAQLFDEILSHKGTLKEIVDGHTDAHVSIEGDEWSTIDFDTPNDFNRAKRLF
ncbi:MAG: nucleotidyltransferase family protein, partial [Candidatus Bathyarchaeota archaeon]|nr:nucleotidyltransferase family protein [Candidatus Bathyarchaeota archaeon]